MKPGGKLEPDEDIGAVVCGFDREINYFKIQTAQLAINAAQTTSSSGLNTPT